MRPAHTTTQWGEPEGLGEDVQSPRADPHRLASTRSQVGFFRQLRTSPHSSSTIGTHPGIPDPEFNDILAYEPVACLRALPERPVRILTRSSIPPSPFLAGPAKRAKISFKFRAGQPMTVVRSSVFRLPLYAVSHRGSLRNIPHQCDPRKSFLQKTWKNPSDSSKVVAAPRVGACWRDRQAKSIPPGRIRPSSAHWSFKPHGVGIQA